MEKKFRSRNMRFLIYPDNPTHVKALSKIKEKYDYAMILHDKDFKEDGSPDKIHIHVVAKIATSACWNTSICKDLGLEPIFSRPCSSINKALQYLIHFNNPEKYQYSIDEVEGSLKNKLVECINSDGKDESDKVYELISYIHNADFLSITEFSAYCCSLGYWDVFRRSGVIFIKMLDEHNKSL